MFKQINIQVIPHGCQRYETYGDYWVDEKGILQIRVSEFENADHALYIAIHELLESWRCAKKGIDFKDIDAFDLAHLDHPDPGLLTDSPYHVAHMQSADIEYMLCRQDGYNFSDYYEAKPIGG